MAIICLCLAGPGAAVADDANTVPPSIELTPAGTELNPIGPELLAAVPGASFTTREAGIDSEYPAGSNVSFACFVDDVQVGCSQAIHRPCCPGPTPRLVRRCVKAGKFVITKSGKRRPCKKPTPGPPVIPPGKVLGYGPYIGWVPLPPGITGGPHTVTVVASDEDGTDPSPPTVTTILDFVPPVAGVVAGPRAVSRDRTPKFTFSATDDRAMNAVGVNPFRAWLRPLSPPGPTIYGNDFANRHLLLWKAACPTHNACWDRTWAVDPGEPWKNGAIPLTVARLDPGLYEFIVKAVDVAGNESAPATHRFRILGARPQAARTSATARKRRAP